MRPATRPDAVPIFDVGRALALHPTIPPDLVHGLGRYFNLRIQAGAFLHAVLRNDLQEAVLHAAPESIVALPRLVRLLLNDAPAYGWGTDDAVRVWLKGRALAAPPAWNRGGRHADPPAPLDDERRPWPTTADGRRAPDYFCIGVPTVEACADAQRCLRKPVCSE